MNLFIAAILITGVIAGFLAWSEKYEDGLTGRIALGGMTAAAVIIVIGHLRSVVAYDYIPPEGVLFVVCNAWFLMRHCYRFIRWTLQGKFAWRRPSTSTPTQEHS